MVITTPLDPRNTWAGRTEEDLQQLIRRLTEIRYFFGGGDGPVVEGVNLNAQMQRPVSPELSLLEGFESY